MDGNQDTKANLRDMPAMIEKGFTHKRNALRTRMRRSVKIMEKQIELIMNQEILKPWVQRITH